MSADLEALLAALLLFEAFQRLALIRSGPPVPGDLIWWPVILAVAWGGVTVFGLSSPFLFVLVPLAGLHAVRTGLGWIGPDTHFLARWRFVPVAVVAVLTGNVWASVGVFLLVSFNRGCVRALLLSLAHANRPRLITPLEVDQIVPPKIRYDRRTGESGMAMLELIMGMMILVTLSSAVFLGTTQRSARLRQLRESTVVRETVVSELETVSAVPFEELAGQNGREFDVPGAGAPGRVAVVFPEEGLAKITVEAPRRGATAIRLTTWRSRRAE